MDNNITIDELHLLIEDIKQIASGEAHEAVYIALINEGVSVRKTEVINLLIDHCTNRGIVKGAFASAFGMFAGWSLLKLLGD